MISSLNSSGMRVLPPLLLAVCFTWAVQDSSNHEHQEHSSHDNGTTVTLMLAKIGLGPAVPLSPLSAESAVCDGESGECLVQKVLHVEDLKEVDDRCWGYEKGCGKEKRLFVPQCEGPASPW